MSNDNGPMIVQSDLSILLDVHAPRFEEARDALAGFALLEKSPEHLHTYRMTPLSLWNAAAAGIAPAEVTASLEEFSRYEVPKDIPFIVSDTMSRFGALVMRDAPQAAESTCASGLAEAAAAPVPRLLLVCSDTMLERRLKGDKVLAKWLSPCEGGFSLRLVDRGTVKIELLKRGWPVRDEASLALIAGYPVNDILLDAFHPQARGGTGDTFPWALALRFKELFPQRRLWLAGGLTPENVALAVREVQPFAVDVASGVEDAAPGVKNMEKVAGFIRAAKHRP